MQYLWIQEAVKRQEFSLEKVFADHNVADAMTKYLSKEPFMRHLEKMGFEFKEGVSEMTRTINGLKLVVNKPWGGMSLKPLYNTYVNNQINDMNYNVNELSEGLTERISK